MWVVTVTASLAYGQSAPERINGGEAVAGDVIVKFKTADSRSRAAVQAVVNADALVPLSRTGEVYLLHSKSRSAIEALTVTKNRPEVVYAEPNYMFHASAIPNDTYFSSVWGMNRIAAPAAWDQTTGSAANVVGVIDTGVDYTHPDLAGNVWSAPKAFQVMINGTYITCPAGSHGFNAITNTCNPMDDAQHGTHVSGTIGAVGNNGTGVAGVNWSTQIMGLKFLDSSGSGTTSNAIKAS
jgi:thermitase